MLVAIFCALLLSLLAERMHVWLSTKIFIHV
ncbi:hypothetical protein HU200_041877 [Digitaria exilis]|uniref:Uncharacterized protein n=1 Tax=Digitaria exilis TaxID=1010633 RepID=A0A835EDG6_9POAL|nr:hypothetical protein HU200_041877 [Digitaria exilis]